MADEPNSTEQTEQERPEAGYPEKPKTLEEQLAELRKDLKDAQQTLKEAGFDIAQHEWRIDALSKLIADLEQTVTDYRPKYPGLKAAQKAHRDYYDDERKCLKEILGDDCVTKVDAKVAELRAVVKTLSDDIAKDEKTLADTKKKRETALRDRDPLKAAFESLMKPAASINERLKELDAFKGEIRKAHDDGEYAIAYWLLTDCEKFEGRLDGELKLIDPDKLRAALKAAWEDYRDATKAFAKLDDEVQELEKAIEAKKTDLTKLEKNLDATIRLELTEIQPSRSKAA